MDNSGGVDQLAIYGWAFAGALVAYVYYGFAVMAIFAKAGLKKWPAWVPFFNTWRILQLGGQKGWWLLVSLVPFVGSLAYLVFLIIAGVNIQTAFRKPGIFYLLALLITPVWYGILAWDSSEWRPAHTPIVPPNGYANAGGSASMSEQTGQSAR